MFDFPANPNPGDKFNPGTGLIYTWDGVAWNLAPQVGGWFKRTVITASTTTFQFDTAASFAEIEVLGGGGGAGSTSGSSGAGLATAGGGGGAGGYAKKLITITDAIRAATKTITIGAGGTAVSGTFGNNGSPSSYTDTVNTLTGNGGGRGNTGGMANTIPVGAPGIGGSASGGDVNVSGSNALPGIGWGTLAVGSAGAAAASGGLGASSQFGKGGSQGLCGASTSAVSSAGGNAERGAGGGGGAAVNAIGSHATSMGGDGGAGLVVITEYR